MAHPELTPGRPADASADETPTRLPLVALPDGVVFPGVVVTVTLERPDGRLAVAAARRADGRVVLVPELGGRLAGVGTVAQVENAGQLPDGTHAAVLRTLARAVVVGHEEGDGSESPSALVRLVADGPATARARELGRELRAVAESIAALRRSRRLPELLRTTSEPGALADGVTAWSEAPASHRVAVLETVAVEARLELVLAWAREHLAEQQLAQRLRDEVAEGIEQRQREFLLRQQLEAIRKELRAIGAEGDDDDLARLRARLDGRDAIPAKVRAAVERELDRLERTGPQSPEQGWIRTWIDRVLDVPWGTVTPDSLDLGAAREVLDADHTGLDDVKQRIVEFLAVRKLRSERFAHDAPGEGATGPGAPAGPGADVHAERRGGGAILALVGPPGVGKTSLGVSVARAMGRRFVRVALGGVRDEAEIRGHRRTYVGAQPGRIVRAITEAGSMNPVVLLDEIDKLSAGGWSGDPTAALLEVLDPAQNHTFRDHYLEVELDLSDVVFLATANQLDSVPAPLLDRMEVVVLDGYTEDEKVAIAQRHLVPRQMRASGLRDDEVELTEAAVRKVIVEHTREAGVRSLERALGTVLRKAATTLATGAGAAPLVIDAGAVRVALGRPRHTPEVAGRTGVPGVATGLAVTSSGGDVLFVEATSFEGQGGLVLTGQLGDVMKESAHIALSYVRANAERLGIDRSSLERSFHLHVPAGAVPKDGPSAGITMTTALVSLLTGRPVNPVAAMTGEVTLQGRVLPVGGVKQKVLAAHRAGLTEVIVPSRNEADLEDVPTSVRAALTIHLAERVDDVLARVLATS